LLNVLDLYLILHSRNVSSLAVVAATLQPKLQPFENVGQHRKYRQAVTIRERKTRYFSQLVRIRQFWKNNQHNPIKQALLDSPAAPNQTSELND
jgi:hypothetical protein